MSHPYTDSFGFPLSAAAAARRMNSERSTGYYDQNGIWRRRRPRGDARPINFDNDDAITKRRRDERDQTGK